MIRKIMIYIGVWLAVGSVLADDNLEPVSKEQQQAITELIGALKHIRKVWAPPGSAAEAAARQQEKSIFQDGQEFKLPEFKPEESIEQQLQEIRDAQQEVVDKLDKMNSGSNSKTKLSDLSGRQSEMLEKLKQFIRDKKSAQLPDDSRRKLDDALKNGSDAVRAMDSNNSKIAELKSRQAQAYISDVLRRIQRESDKRQETVLNNIQKDLNELDKKQQSGKSTSKELRRLAEKLKRNAVNQHRKGTGENARELAELARDFAKQDSDSKKTDKEKLDQLKKAVAGLRENKKGTVKQLEEAMKKIEDYRKQLDYLKKHPDAMSDAEKKEMIKDMELAVQDAVNAMEKMKKQDGTSSKEGQDTEKGESGKTSDRGKSGDSKEENNGKGNKGEKGKGSKKTGDKQRHNETGKPGGKDEKSNNKGDQRKGGGKAVPKTPEELRKAMRRLLPNYNPTLFNEGSNSERLERFFRDLLISGKAVLSSVESKERVFQFKNDEVPEKYREEVARYFEALSDTSGKRKSSERKKK